MGLIITTMAGGFTVAFMARMMWGKSVEDWGPIGGYIAAAFIIGTGWTFNHGVGMIVQQGSAWVDQAFAVFAGLFFGNVLIDRVKLGSSIANIIVSIIGGVLGGFILSCLPM